MASSSSFACNHLRQKWKNGEDECICLETGALSRHQYSVYVPATDTATSRCVGGPGGHRHSLELDLAPVQPPCKTC